MISRNSATITLATIVTALTIGSSGCTKKLGEIIKVDADGQISAQEKQDFLQTVIDNETYDESSPIVKQVASDLDILASQRIDSWRTLSNLSLHTVTNRRQMQKAYTNCYGVYKKLPSTHSAFPCKNNWELTQYEDEAIAFLPTFFHEWGHYQNYMKMDKYASEFPAEANRMWVELNLFGLDQTVGSLFAYDIFSRIPASEDSDRDKYWEKYEDASLGFVLAGIHFNGNMDLAADFMFRKGNDPIKALFDGELEKYGGMPKRDVWKQAWASLLSMSGFSEYMHTSVMPNSNGNNGRTEASELIDYFKVMHLDKLIEAVESEGRDAATLIDERDNALIDFAEQGYEKGFHNPIFRNRAIDDVTSLYLDEARELWTSSMQEDYSGLQQGITLLERAISMNNIFPCDFDEWNCDESYSNPRENHLDSYNIIARMQWQLGNFTGSHDDIDKAFDYIDMFLDKFYPILQGEETDYSYETHGHTLTMALLSMTNFAYYMGMEMVYDAASLGDIEGMKKYRCIAKLYINIYNRATCSNVSDAELMQKCYSNGQSLENEESMREKEENLSDVVEAACFRP